MASGGVLRVSSAVDAGVAELRFADSGPGIPAEYREAIFEPFFSLRGSTAAESSRDHIGAGLGLFICREIVSQHDGELVALDSAAGAVFVVRLPTRF
jgi:signal transduction histidine kinase